MRTEVILVVCLGADACATEALLRKTAVRTLTVTGIAEAHKALLDAHYSAGLLLVGEAPGCTVDALDELLEQWQSVRWVGVFAPRAMQHDGYRRLILQHLCDFHTWSVDEALLSSNLRRTLAPTEPEENISPHSPTSHDAGSAKGMAIVGSSAAVLELRRNIAKVAQVSAPVLIWGESGSGKELVALAIHQHSRRAGKPFVAMNCGAVPASLIQSELFGYVRGAFTGAVKEKIGLIESAQGGTLFLDEVGDLALELQVNLLRFLQERSIMRVGSSQPIEVDVRVVAASHVRLDEAVRAGQFREDLLYRLNVLPVSVPALRDRKEDLVLLAQHFFEKYKSDRPPRLIGFGSRALQAMMQHDWPGNVRELINRVRRAMVMSEGRLITAQDLGLQSPLESTIGEALEDARERAECEAIQESLLGHGNNKTQAARNLGVSRMTLYRLMDKHGIEL